MGTYSKSTPATTGVLEKFTCEFSCSYATQDYNSITPTSYRPVTVVAPSNPPFLPLVSWKSSPSNFELAVTVT